MKMTWTWDFRVTEAERTRRLAVRRAKLEMGVAVKTNTSLGRVRGRGDLGLQGDTSDCPIAPRVPPKTQYEKNNTRPYKKVFRRSW